MDIIHERPSQRLHYRVSAPMRITLGEQTYEAADWGLGGCRVTGLSTPLPEAGSQHTLLCTLPFQGFNITLKSDAEVVRSVAATGEIAFRFINLGERETALMQHFVEDLVRGKMTEVGDTIVRIDTPVTPVPTKPDPNPVDAMPVKRWPVKQIVMTIFYLALGILVFGYVGIYAFATLFRLEVSAAVVSAERVVITAPVSGQVSMLTAATGQNTEVNSLLAVLNDTSRMDNLIKARSALAAAKAELAETEVLLTEEQRRSEGYALVARNNVRQAVSQLDGMELARQNAALKLDRLKTLEEKGLVRADDVAAAELALATMVSELDRKKIHIQELEELIAGGDSVHLFTGTAFAGRLAEMQARVARLKIVAAHQEALVADLARSDGRHSIHAPFTGRIVQADVSVATTVKQGDPLLVLERSGDHSVTAFLTQEEIQQVRLGTPARLFFPTEGRWIDATVAEVDRTSGFVDEITETHRFRAPDARSGRVSLTATSALPASGTPVTVYFRRHRNNIVWRTVDQLVGAL